MFHLSITIIPQKTDQPFLQTKIPHLNPPRSFRVFTAASEGHPPELRSVDCKGARTVKINYPKWPRPKIEVPGIYLGYGPFPVTVTTRIITSFLVGNPYNSYNCLQHLIIKWNPPISPPQITCSWPQINCNSFNLIDFFRRKTVGRKLPVSIFRLNMTWWGETSFVNTDSYESPANLTYPQTTK